MDKTEKTFKIALEAVITAILIILSIQFIPFNIVVFIICLFLAHTINWIFNGHIVVVFLEFSSGTSPENFHIFCEYLKKKFEREPSIKFAAIFGSFAKNEAHKKSDLDIGMIRYPGISNGIRACIFTLQLRIYTLFHVLPVDLFLSDSPEYLKQFWKEKTPVILKEK